MKTEKLTEILRLHKLWHDTGTKEGKMADLRGADLQDANLQYAILREANLRGANLRGADIDYACLQLHCGGQFKADMRICKQLVAHTLRIMELSGEGDEELLIKMRNYKKGWHREEEFVAERR